MLSKFPTNLWISIQSLFVIPSAKLVVCCYVKCHLFLGDLAQQRRDRQELWPQTDTVCWWQHVKILECTPPFENHYN